MDKFCKDCKHFIPGGLVYVMLCEDVCTREELKGQPDLVHGHRRCARPADARREEDKCGRAAKFFEPKEEPKPRRPWWRFWS